MFSFFRNVFRKKNIKDPEEDEFENLSLDEKAVILSDSFVKYLKENCDFDLVRYFIEDPNEITPESVVWQMIKVYNLNPYEDKNLTTDFEVARVLLNVANKSTPATKIITFKISREYNGLYDTRMMIGLILENGLLWFPKDFNERSFDHYNFTGYIRGYKPSPFHGSFYYIYNYKSNVLSHIIDLPINNTFNDLSLRAVKDDNPPYNPYKNSSEESTDFFPYKRCYWLSFRINISDDSFSYKALATIAYKGKIFRNMEFNIYDSDDFRNAIDRMLFPFNLEYEKLKDLNLERISLDNLENTFEDEFKLNEMIDV